MSLFHCGICRFPRHRARGISTVSWTLLFSAYWQGKGYADCLAIRCKPISTFSVHSFSDMGMEDYSKFAAVLSVTARIAFPSIDRICSIEHDRAETARTSNGRNRRPKPRSSRSANKSVCSALLWATGAKPLASAVCLKGAYLTGLCATAGNSHSASKPPILVKCCRPLSVLSVLLSRSRNV